MQQERVTREWLPVCGRWAIGLSWLLALAVPAPDYPLPVTHCTLLAAARADADTPIAFWDFDPGNEMTGRVPDRVGPPFAHGRLMGKVTTPTGSDGGLLLKAADAQHVRFDPAQKLAQPFSKGLTIEARVRQDAASGPAEVGTIFGRYDVKDRRSFSLYTRGAAIGFSLCPGQDSGQQMVNVETSGLQPDRFTVITALFEPGKAAEIWVDGVKRASKPASLTGLFVSEAPLAAGCRFFGESPINAFNGVIDWIKVYDHPVRPTGPISGPPTAAPRTAAPAAPAVRVDDLPLIRRQTTPPAKGAAMQEPPVPFRVDWSYEGAEQQENGLRGAIILNGAWRWQPAQEGAAGPDAQAWLFRNVPGCQAPYFLVRDAAGKVVSSWKGKPFSGTELAWIEREFAIPAAWKGRAVWVTLWNTLEGGEVFLDGKSLGYTRADLPFDVAVPGAQPGSRHTLTVKTKAITDDVWLMSAPPALALTDVWPIVSWRERMVTIVAEGKGRLPQGARVRAAISRDEAGEQVVARLDAVTPEATTSPPTLGGIEGGPWVARPRIAWPAALKPWSPDHPNLYWIAAEVVGSDGTVLDRSLPVRTGFREFRLQGGGFHLNGKPIHLRGNNIVPFGTGLNRIGNRDPKILRHLFSGWKDTGLNTFASWSGNDLNFDVSDEVGMMTYHFIPTFLDLKRYQNVAEIDGYMHQRLRYFLRRLRRHPSIVMWMIPGGAHVWDYNPGKLDGSYDPRTIWAALAEYDRSLDATRAELAADDPSRPWTYHSGGNMSPVHTTMSYLGFDMDLQERCNWPLAWSKVRHKPLMASEVGMPFSSHWFARPSRGEYARAGMWILNLEYAAMYFGEAPYRDEPDAQLLVHANGDGEAMVYARSEAADRLEELFTRQTILAWRTYGANFVLHGPVRHWYDFAYPPRDMDARRRGAVGDHLVLEENVGPLRGRGRVAREALRPLLAYVGGPKDAFTARDHAYTAGERVVKSAVVINDTEEDVRLSGSWQVEGRAGVLARGTLSGTAAAGGRAFLPITFACPAVKTREPLTLRITLQEGKLSDELALEAFPNATPAVPMRSRVLLFDPRGETAKLLARLGVRSTPVAAAGPFPADGLLVIGRHALDDAAVSVKLHAAGLDDAIAAGLRVLVFEQAASNLWGLKLEEPRPRHTFIAAPGHPALAGLSDADLRYWRGSSDLKEAYPPSPNPDPNVPNSYPMRLWKWGADNAVATMVFERPQVGAARALICSGFDLMETPLLEVARGKGRLLFCQMDVTNRYGADPAATRLTHNLLRYLDGVKPASADAGQVVNVLKQPVPGWSAVRVEENRFRKPAAPQAWGVVLSDFYYRPTVTLPCVKGPGQPEPAVLALGKVDGRPAILTAAEPACFPRRWQRAKYLRALAALRIDCGGSSLDGPLAGLQGDTGTLYPVVWQEGFVHPYDHWRW